MSEVRAEAGVSPDGGTLTGDPERQRGNAVTLHSVVDGPEDAPVVVLSPSLGTSLEVWDAQAAELAVRCRVIRYDLRGHGRSAVPPGPYEIADLGRDLVALLGTHGVGRAHLVGLSIGGMASMWAAAHAPHRVASLTLCCTSANVGPELAAAYADRAATVRARGSGAVAEAAVSRWLTPAFAAAHPDEVERLEAMVATTPAEGYAASCDALASMDLEEELRSITAPTLVVSGAQDLALPPEHGRRIADAIPGAAFALVDAAHLAPVEQPRDVAALILRSVRAS